MDDAIAEPTVELPAATLAAAESPPTEPPAASDDGSSPEDPGKRRRWLTWFIVITLLLAVGVVGTLGYDAFTQRLAARGDLERALELVKQADDTVLAVDDVITMEITVGLSAAAEEASEQVVAAGSDIEDALGLLDDAYENLDEEDQSIADALRDAGESRLAMLAEAPLLLEANSRAARALDPASEAMELLLEAEELSNDATAQFNKQTKDGVTASTQLSSQADEKLEQAGRLFRRAKRKFPSMDVGLFLDYIEAKRALIETGIEIDELWLADKIADANELVEQYNEDDAEAAKLAEGLPESETTPIAEAYEKATEDATERYLEHRDAAAHADTLLRDLLGTNATGTAEATGTASADATGVAGTTGSEDDETDALWSHWGWPAATAVLGFIFTGLVFAQWLKRRKNHQLAWTVGLLFYAVAAVMEAYSEYSGVWDPTIYRIYIVLAASLVGFLGLGTLYLVTKRPIWGHLYLAGVLGAVAVFFYGTFTTELVIENLVPGITVGGSALGPGGSFPRFMSLPINITGSIFLLGGSLWSIFRFMAKPAYRYRVWANVLIALGTILIAAAGGMARGGQTVGLYPAEMVASAILLAGFLLAGTLEKGAKTIIDQRHDVQVVSQDQAEPEEAAEPVEPEEPEEPAEVPSPPDTPS